MRLRVPALIAEPREAQGGAQFPGTVLLHAGKIERALELGLGLHRVRIGDDSAISPTVRWMSASHHLSPDISTAVSASSMQRWASANCPSYSYAPAKSHSTKFLPELRSRSMFVPTPPSVPAEVAEPIVIF